jgi:hypothetical protein
LIPVQPPAEGTTIDGVRPDLRLRGVIDGMTDRAVELPNVFTKDSTDRHGDLD